MYFFIILGNSGVSINDLNLSNLGKVGSGQSGSVGSFSGRFLKPDDIF
jgi:hypothetical protein